MMKKRRPGVGVWHSGLDVVWDAHIPLGVPWDVVQILVFLPPIWDTQTEV